MLYNLFFQGMTVKNVEEQTVDHSLGISQMAPLAGLSSSKRRKKKDTCIDEVLSDDYG